MSIRRHVLVSVLVAVCAGQRSPYAGRRPIGYPEIETTTSNNTLGNRFAEGQNGTTERLPVEALGDRELVNRLGKLPQDKQPFWFINWQALEEHRKRPQTYPQRPNVFVESLSFGNNDTNFKNRFQNNQGNNTQSTSITSSNQQPPATTIAPSSNQQTPATTTISLSKEQPLQNAPALTNNQQPLQNTSLLSTNQQPLQNTPSLSTNQQPLQNTPSLSTNQQPLQNIPVSLNNQQPLQNDPVVPINQQPLPTAPVVQSNQQPLQNTPVVPSSQQPLQNTPVVPSKPPLKTSVLPSSQHPLLNQGFHDGPKYVRTDDYADPPFWNSQHHSDEYFHDFY